MKNKRVLWITQTAVTTALLIVIQAVTSPLGNTMITGSLVNLTLIVGVMIGGLSCGATVALISPVFAKLFGIGPLWTLIPFIALGNLVLILCWHFLGHQRFGAQTVVHAITAVSAALLKFFTLYLCIVKLALPVFLSHLPDKQVSTFSALFSIPQLYTALIGGGLALVILPLLQKALQKEA